MHGKAALQLNIWHPKVYKPLRIEGTRGVDAGVPTLFEYIKEEESSLKKFVNIYNEIMSYLGVVCLAGFIISVMVQVISRTFLPTTPSWTEEAARYLFIYMVAFGCSVAIRKREFVGVDLLTSLLPVKLQQILSTLIHILLLAFCAFILIKSVLGFALIQYRMVSTAMQIPMQYVYFSMILLFGLLILSLVFEIILILTGQDKEEKEVVA